LAEFGRVGRSLYLAELSQVVPDQNFTELTLTQIWLYSAESVSVEI